MIDRPQLNQSTFLDELGPQIDKFENRVRKDRVFSQLWIWADMLRSVWKDAIQEREEAKAALAKRDDEIYQQFMQLELYLDKLPYSQESQRLKEISGNIKGLLACLTFACFLSAFDLGDDDQLRVARLRARNRRGREEMLAA